MSKDERLYIEKRDNGKFALERANARRAIGLFDRQADAIKRATEMEPDYKPHLPGFGT
jgi:hypothetical protein